MVNEKISIYCYLVLNYNVISCRNVKKSVFTMYILHDSILVYDTQSTVLLLKGKKGNSMTDSSIKSPFQTFYRLQLPCSLFRFTLLNIPCNVGRFLYKLFLHFYTYKLKLFAYKLKKCMHQRNCLHFWYFITCGMISVGYS